jgi:FtsZ-binding cell division protein ZapB
MVAVQGLIDRTNAMITEMQELKNQNEALRKEVENLKELLKK